MEDFLVTAQIDQIYDMLATQGITLIKLYEKIHNYYSMSWLLIPSNDLISPKDINAFAKGIEKESKEFLDSKRVDTNLFISMAICIYVLKTHNKRIPEKITEAMSLVLNELKDNKRLRTPEMVGDILFFLSKMNMFKDNVNFLINYLKHEREAAIKARNCINVIDCCFGLLPLEENFDFHIFEDCLKNSRLLNIDRITKVLIILSFHEKASKESYFSCLRDRLKDEYTSKLSYILQAIINGISLIESDLPAEETKRVFEELRENEWTEAIEIDNKEIKLKKLSPSLLRILNSKTIGLSLLSMEFANKKTKVSLYPNDFKEFQNAWKEKKFGFGIDKQQLQYLHYFSLIMMMSVLILGLWLSNLYEVIWKDINKFVLMGFEIQYLIPVSIYTLIFLVILGIVVTYHRIFRKLIQSGKIAGFDEIIQIIPIVGWIVKKIRGEKE